MQSCDHRGVCGGKHPVASQLGANGAEQLVGVGTGGINGVYYPFPGKLRASGGI